MSTDQSGAAVPGDQAFIDAALADAKALVAEATMREEQFALIDPVTPEEMVEAREALGPGAGRLAVVTEARQRKRGRPPGARNKRTDDFAKYILSFGQHPAITMMQIQATPPEVLIAASEQPKVHSFTKSGNPNIVTERLSYEQAQSLRLRAAEGLMPYLEQKKPVAVDATIRHDGDLIISGLTHDAQTVAGIIEADFLDVDEDGAGIA